MTHFLYILGLDCNYNVTFGTSYYTQWMVRFYHMTGLLIFRTVMEPWNSGKSAKSCEIHKNSQNTVKFARNLIQCMSIQHVWNLSRLLGMFNCRKLANSSWNFITTTVQANNVPCCEKFVTSQDVKSFAIGSFLECFVVKIANDYLC